MTKKPVFRTRPEAAIQKKVVGLLRARGWFVRTTHGNAYQSGWADIFCFHPEHGFRWIDIKNPDAYEFTQAQILQWPQWEEGGVGIWILVASTNEEYQKLFGEPNWRDYWKDRYNRHLTPVREIINPIILENSPQKNEK